MKWHCLFEASVETEWLDEYDHVNFLYYQRIADLATTRYWQTAMEVCAAPCDFVIVETYVRYLKELRLGDAVRMHSAVAGYDARRIHFVHLIESGAKTCCVIELVVLAFDLTTRRATRFSAPMLDWLAAPHFAQGLSSPLSAPLSLTLKVAG